MRLRISLGKFGWDLAWNYASLAVLAVGGILVNLIIARVYGAAALGVFNQVYAVYVVLSQFAVGGIHLSALKHVAEHAEDHAHTVRIAWSAVLLAAGLGSAVAAAFYLGAGAIGRVLDSPDVAAGIGYAAPGLALFAVNKVLLAILNGLRRMRTFAVGQALRFVVLVGFVAAAPALALGEEQLTAAFTVAESVLLVVLLAFVVPALWPRGAVLGRDWLGRHLIFGARGFMSGIILETNARVDVLMLGVFLGDRALGIYSFASMLAEGFYNLLVVVRNNVNPLLVPLLRDRDHEGINRLLRQVQLRLYPVTLLMAGAVLLAYPLAVEVIFREPVFLESWPVLAILFAGIVVCAGFVPFDGMLLQAGRPGSHTWLTSVNVGTNVLLNLALIPWLGIHGAALGTALALALTVLYLNLAVWRLLGFRLRPLG